jgi:2-oxo-4-hydroxy-4-carboxy--5-ureidoimidazoline (OHCU) decarboxylase
VTATAAGAGPGSEPVPDEVPPDEAMATLRPLFEGAPRFLARLVEARPLGTWDRLFEQARAIAHGMPDADQIELVNAHPRLGARPETVSAASFREQGYDRQADGPPSALERLAALNAAYETRFGFRYCVFVAGRPLAALLPDLEAALGADRERELHRGIDAVVDIARARHDAGIRP